MRNPVRSRWAVLCTLLALVNTAPADEASRNFDRDAWKKDFAQLESEFEYRYANLAWMASPQSGVDVVALHRRTLAALENARTDGEARAAFRAFVAGFRDGHLAELPMLAEPAGAMQASEPPSPRLDPSDPQSVCAALGFASTGSVAFSLPLETLPGSKLIADGLIDPFRTSLIDLPGGGKVGVLRIQNFRDRPFPAVCLRAWSNLKRRGADINADSIADAATGTWFDILAERLRTLHAYGARAIIVDIGNNSGGNDSGDWAARLFTDRPVASSRLLVSTAADGIAYLDEEIDSLASLLEHRPPPVHRQELRDALAFFRARKAEAASKRCDLSWAWNENRPWEPDACNNLVAAGFASGPLRTMPGFNDDPDAAEELYWPATVRTSFGAWADPVYVLTDRRTYSSAEMFAAVMQDNAIARIVGVRTGGDGCGFMSSATPLVLTHSRLRFRIPNCVRLRADESDEVAGIAPDMPLPPTEGESPRARAMRFVERIDADLGPGP